MRDQLDLLLRIERLTEELNRRMGAPSAAAFKRYPLTFGLLALFGVMMVSEGLKGFLERIGFLHDKPLYLLAIGLVILTILGSVYRKVNK